MVNARSQFRQKLRELEQAGGAGGDFELLLAAVARSMSRAQVEEIVFRDEALEVLCSVNNFAGIGQPEAAPRGGRAGAGGAGVVRDRWAIVSAAATELPGRQDRRMMSALNPREQRLIVLAGILVTVAVMYIYVLEPRYQRLDMLRSQVPALNQDLQWMQQQLSANRELMGGTGQPVADRPPLLTVIEQTASQAGLRQQISRMAPAEEGRVRVWFDGVPFDPWLRWLDSVRRQNISVHAANIVRDEQGKVDVRLTVSG